MEHGYQFVLIADQQNAHGHHRGRRKDGGEGLYIAGCGFVLLCSCTNKIILHSILHFLCHTTQTRFQPAGSFGILTVCYRTPSPQVGVGVPPFFHTLDSCWLAGCWREILLDI